jgi:hypothetical protein
MNIPNILYEIIFYMLEITNIVIVQNFGVISGKCNIVRNSTSSNYSQHWIIKVYNY